MNFIERISKKRSKTYEVNPEDKYELTKSIQVVDVKGYLQKEFDRAEEREKYIVELEDKMKEAEKTSIKYDALLVVQEKTQARIERQDQRIKDLKAEIEARKNAEKILRSKLVDVKVNAEKKLKEKDSKIRELRKQLREVGGKK
jgi:septal ring factor EnvC (AmiA/AmiB activator)